MNNWTTVVIFIGAISAPIAGWSEGAKDSIKSGEYLSNSELRDLLQSHDVFCSNHDASTNSCKYTLQPLTISENIAAYDILAATYTEADKTLKLRLTLENAWTNDGLCSKVSEFGDNFQLFDSTNLIGSIVDTDTESENNEVITQYRKHFKLEFPPGSDVICEMFSLNSNVSGEPATYKIEAFVDGVPYDETVRDIVSGFSGSAASALVLR